MYSLRAFARDVGISHSHLSRILTHKKRLSMHRALQLAEKLKLEGAEREGFLRAVGQSWLVRACDSAKLVGDGQERIVRGSAANEFTPMGQWYYSALLAVLAVKGADHRVSALAEQLGISVRQVSSALRQLEKLGLVQQVKGIWFRCYKTTTAASPHSEKTIRTHHRHMLELALKAFDSAHDSSHQVSGSTLMLDPRHMSEAQRRIERFCHQMKRFLVKGRPSRLYRLNVQLFPIGKNS